MACRCCQLIRTRMVDRISRLFGPALLPERCHFCERGGVTGPVCAGCQNRLPWDDRAPDRAWAAFRYTASIAGQIVALKFHARLAPAHVLGTLMAQRLARRARPLPELLLPVPLHHARLRTRGYNQSLELARVITGHLRIRLAPAAARRVRSTPEQTRLNAAQRLRNVRGAFEVSDVVRGRHIAILDDVITTGATSGELARMAYAAGAREVEIWAAARAELGFAQARVMLAPLANAR